MAINFKTDDWNFRAVNHPENWKLNGKENKRCIICFVKANLRDVSTVYWKIIIRKRSNYKRGKRIENGKLCGIIKTYILFKLFPDINGVLIKAFVVMRSILSKNYVLDSRKEGRIMKFVIEDAFLVPYAVGE